MATTKIEFATYVDHSYDGESQRFHATEAEALAYANQRRSDPYVKRVTVTKITWKIENDVHHFADEEELS